MLANRLSNMFFFPLKYDPVSLQISTVCHLFQSLINRQVLNLWHFQIPYLDTKPGLQHPSIQARAGCWRKMAAVWIWSAAATRGRKQKSWQGVSRPFPVISTHSCLLQRRHRVTLTTSQHHMCEPLVLDVSITVQISSVSMLEWETWITKAHL